MTKDYLFDLCEAFYCFAADYHEGQSSRLYTYFARLGRLGFRPSLNLTADTLSDQGKDLYNRMVNNLG